MKVDWCWSFIQDVLTFDIPTRNMSLSLWVFQDCSNSFIFCSLSQSDWQKQELNCEKNQRDKEKRSAGAPWLERSSWCRSQTAARRRQPSAQTLHLQEHNNHPAVPSVPSVLWAERQRSRRTAAEEWGAARSQFGSEPSEWWSGTRMLNQT